jgi:hypothetical protein
LPAGRHGVDGFHGKLNILIDKKHVRCPFIQRLLYEVFPAIADATGLILAKNDTLIFVGENPLTHEKHPEINQTQGVFRPAKPGRGDADAQ